MIPVELLLDVVLVTALDTKKKVSDGFKRQSEYAIGEYMTGTVFQIPEKATCPVQVSDTVLFYGFGATYIKERDYYVVPWSNIFLKDTKHEVKSNEIVQEETSQKRV